MKNSAIRVSQRFIHTVRSFYYKRRKKVPFLMKLLLFFPLVLIFLIGILFGKN